MFNLLKKVGLYLILLLGVIFGYQYLTGRSIADLPQEIVNKLQEKSPPGSTNPKYYKDPADNIPKN
jgi:hypothetical protein